MVKVILMPQAQVAQVPRASSSRLKHWVVSVAIIALVAIGFPPVQDGHGLGGCNGAGGNGRLLQVAADASRGGKLAKSYREVRDLALAVGRIPLLRPYAEAVVITLDEVVHIVRQTRRAARVSLDLERLGRRLDALEGRRVERVAGDPVWHDINGDWRRLLEDHQRQMDGAR